VSIDHKPEILGSSDATFRGDVTRHNPEELLIASLSACHMLWFLHLCAEADVVVTSYVDEAVGVMEENETGGGQFVEVSLHPVVTVSERWMMDQATELHKRANERCFIANSVNFPVRHFPDTKSIPE
jgi:organic hydroperoxide reductase OsmC/OhrA